MNAIDRYAIKYKDKVSYFNNHVEAVAYVLSLTADNEKIDIIKYGSWQKILIHIEGEVGEIQRLVKIVTKWEKKSKK